MDKQIRMMVIDLCDQTINPLNGLKAACLMAESLPDTQDRDAMRWAIDLIYDQLEAVQELHNKMHEIAREESPTLTVVE